MLNTALVWRRRASPSNPNPAPIISHDDGSGTAATGETLAILSNTWWLTVPGTELLADGSQYSCTRAPLAASPLPSNVVWSAPYIATVRVDVDWLSAASAAPVKSTLKLTFPPKFTAWNRSAP